MYSFKLRNVVRLSDPRHFDHILPFLCPEDIPHLIDLSADDICTMHEEDGDTVQRMPFRKSTRFRITASVEPVLVTPDSDALDADSGENLGELDTGEPDTAEQDKNPDFLYPQTSPPRGAFWDVSHLVFIIILEQCSMMYSRDR